MALFNLSLVDDVYIASYSQKLKTTDHDIALVTIASGNSSSYRV